MLDLTGQGTAQTCSGVTRRDFLQAGTLGAAGLSLAHLQQLDARAAETGAAPGNSNRSVIMIFNLGAPSQLDTFDPKPEAPLEIRGPFKDIATASSDIRISEILPRHAKLAKYFSLVRSVNDNAPAVHDVGWELMQTGRFFSGGINTPHAGAVASYLVGRRTDLPPFVVLPELMVLAAAIFRTVRREDFSARPTIRSSSTLTPPNPISSFPTCFRPGRSAKSAWNAGRSSAVRSIRRWERSSGAKTPSSSTPDSSPPSAS